MISGLLYRAALRDDWIVDGHVAAIREQFADALGAAGWPDGACLFVTGRDTRTGRRRQDENDDAPVDADAVFFSPASVSAVPHLIAACGAEPSPPPERACATLLVGKQTDWDLLPRLTH